MGGAGGVARRLMLQRLLSWARALKRDIVTLWFAYRHPGMPLTGKILAVLIVAYAFSPVDLIPDFIPVLGFVDEVILLPVCIWFVLRLTPQPVLADARQQAQAWMDASKPRPRNYIAAALFVLLWCIAGWMLWRWMVS